MYSGKKLHNHAIEEQFQKLTHTKATALMIIVNILTHYFFFQKLPQSFFLGTSIKNGFPKSTQADSAPYHLHSTLKLPKTYSAIALQCELSELWKTVLHLWVQTLSVLVCLSKIGSCIVSSLKDET